MVLENEDLIVDVEIDFRNINNVVYKIDSEKKWSTKLILNKKDQIIIRPENPIPTKDLYRGFFFCRLENKEKGVVFDCRLDVEENSNDHVVELTLKNKSKFALDFKSFLKKVRLELLLDKDITANKDDKNKGKI